MSRLRRCRECAGTNVDERCGTYDGTNRIYVNGVKVGEDAGGGGPSGITGTTGLSIGADNPPGSGSPLLGEIDQLRIFSVARTDAQIASAAATRV